MALEQGWNLISLPQVTQASPITQVLPDFGTKYDQISRADSLIGQFESFGDSPSSDQFTSLDPGVGYWLFVTDPVGVDVDISGTPAQLPARQLDPGWQLLPGADTTMSIAQWLQGLSQGTHYGEVKTYDASTSSFASATQIEPGKSYAVEILQTVTWTPPAPGAASGPTQFVYDGDGARIKKISASGTTLFVGSYEVAPGGETTSYIHAGGMRIASETSSGKLLYYLPDHLGSTHVITDDTGALAELNEYTPYGSMSRHEGVEDVPQKFTGQRLDTETSFYFYNARYYDAELGRFISADSVAQEPTDPQSLNRYSYARNNPVMLSDPSGHFFAALVAIIGQIISAAITGAIVSAAFAAITGGDIGKAALNGAIQAAVFAPFAFGASNLFPDAGAGQYFGRALIKAAGSAASSAAGAAVRGEPVGKAAFSGARFSFIASVANFAVGQWSGYTRNDQFKALTNGTKAPGKLLKIGTNGITTTEAAAKTTMEKFSYDGWLYNQTRGGLADIVESAQELLFGPGSWSRSAAKWMDSAAVSARQSGSTIRFIAHSQGAIQFAQAAHLMSESFQGTSSTVEYLRPPVGAVQAFSGAWHAGLSVTAFDPGHFDIVSAIGFPAYIPTATVALPFFATDGAQAHVSGGGKPIFDR